MPSRLRRNFALSLFLFVVRFSFRCESFSFRREVFLFAVRLILWVRQLWATVNLILIFDVARFQIAESMVRLISVYNLSLTTLWCHYPVLLYATVYLNLVQLEFSFCQISIIKYSYNTQHYCIAFKNRHL